MKVVMVLRSLLIVLNLEMSQTLRDRRMLATLIVSPVLQLVVFGYAIDLDVDRIPTVVCDQDGTPGSRDLTQAFFADRTFFRGADVANPSQAEDALETGAAAAALIVPRGFALHRARAWTRPRCKSSSTERTSRWRRSHRTRRASSCSCTGLVASRVHGQASPRRRSFLG